MLITNLRVLLSRCLGLYQAARTIGASCAQTTIRFVAGLLTSRNRRFLTLALALSVICALRNRSAVTAAIEFVWHVTAVNASMAIANTCRDVRTWYLSKYGTQYLISASNLRAHFNRTPTCERPAAEVHTHPLMAQQRSTASRTAVEFTRWVGKEPYFIQMSRSDQEKGYAGSRDIYWVKDFMATPRTDELLDIHVPVIIDTDYYMEMPSFLAVVARPVILYTIIPEALTHDDEESTFTFTSEGKIRYTYSGGAEYEHDVWNYAGDNVTAIRYAPGTGVPTHVTVYLVEKRRMGPHRYLVLLAPLKHFCGLPAIVASTLPGPRLQRLRPCGPDGWLRLRIMTPKGMFVSTGVAGQYNSATIAASDDDMLHSMTKVYKQTLQVPTVESALKVTKKEAVMLTDYHTHAAPRPADYVCPLSDSVRAYQFDPKRYNQDLPPPMQAFMSPIVNGGFVGVRGNAAIVDMIANRMSYPATAIKTLSPHMLECIHEFALLVAGDAKHSLIPADFDEIWERMDRPAQHAQIMHAVTLDDESPLAGLEDKNEAYQKAKTKRPIVTFKEKRKMDYMSYMYPYMEHLKNLHWYCVGMTPSQIARKVSNLCIGAVNTIDDTDASFFDGTVALAARVLEEQVMLALYKPEFHSDLLENERSQHGSVIATIVRQAGEEFLEDLEISPLKAVSKWGQNANIVFNRGSGSGQTSSHNALLNAFKSFKANRGTLGPDGKYLNAAQAWDRLGLYFGDDGLDRDMDTNALLQSCRELGLSIKINRVKRGDIGVTFLSRQYGPDVWYGDLSSCCDIPRQLTKFHLTAHLPPNVTPQMKLIAKAQSYWLSDANTPIIGCLVNRVRELSNGFQLDSVTDVDKARRMARDGEVNLYSPLFLVRDVLPYQGDWAKGTPEEVVQYPNDDTEWMKHYVSAVLPNFDHDRFEEAVAAAKCLDDLLRLPECMERPPPLPTNDVVVDEMVVEGPNHVAPALALAPAIAEQVENSKSKKREREQPELEVEIVARAVDVLAHYSKMAGGDTFTFGKGEPTPVAVETPVIGLDLQLYMPNSPGKWVIAGCKIGPHQDKVCPKWPTELNGYSSEWWNLVKPLVAQKYPVAFSSFRDSAAPFAQVNGEIVGACLGAKASWGVIDRHNMASLTCAMHDAFPELESAHFSGWEVWHHKLQEVVKDAHVRSVILSDLPTVFGPRRILNGTGGGTFVCCINTLGALKFLLLCTYELLHIPAFLDKMNDAQTRAKATRVLEEQGTRIRLAKRVASAFETGKHT